MTEEIEGRLREEIEGGERRRQQTSKSTQIFRIHVGNNGGRTGATNREAERNWIVVVWVPRPRDPDSVEDEAVSDSIRRGHAIKGYDGLTRGLPGPTLRGS